MNSTNIYVKLASIGMVTSIIIVSLIFNSQYDGWYQNLEHTTCRINSKKVMVTQNPTMLDEIYQRYPYNGIIDFTIVGPNYCTDMSKTVYKSFDKENVKKNLQKYIVGDDMSCYYLKDGRFKEYMKKMLVYDDVYFEKEMPHFKYLPYILLLLYIYWMCIVEVCV